MPERITITIETAGAAFDDEPASEIARILRRIATSYADDGRAPLKVYDINGNFCGSVVVERTR